jgi:hypothetical protein
MAETPASTTQTITLHNDITVNGVTHRAGRSVNVPKAQAEDIGRMDYEHEQYKNTLHTKTEYRPVRLQTIAVGGGAV